MPYINKKKREKIDSYITSLQGEIGDDLGTLNYIITRLAMDALLSRELNYANISSIIGTVRLSADEIQRRVLDNYEDYKMWLNGDITEFQLVWKEITSMRTKAITELAKDPTWEGSNNV